jgi:hypothetical protein
MTTPLALTTSGKSTLYRPAERAVVTIKIHSEGPSQQQVSEEVTDRSNELRAILKEMALKDNTGMPHSHCSSIIIPDPFTTDPKKAKQLLKLPSPIGA